jgi:hypothetical protein
VHRQATISWAGFAIGPGPFYCLRYSVRRAYLDGLPVASGRVPIKNAGGQTERTGPVRMVRRALAI